MALVEISEFAKKEDRLTDIQNYLEELKHLLGEVIDEYEDDEASERTLDILTEALDGMEDAYDCIEEVLAEGL